MFSDEPAPNDSLLPALGMRRWMGGACVLIMLLAPIAGAGAQGSAPAPDAESRSEAAEQALVAGLLAMRSQNLLLAERLFKQAAAADADGGRVHDAATEELSYRLPLKRVERHLESKELGEAEQILRALRERHQSDEHKSRYLDHLLARLRDGALDPDAVIARPGDRRTVIRSIERTLEQFFENNGRYPSGYEEINEILPAGQHPLTAYEIVHYTGSGRAYGLTLRNRLNPENRLTVQSTGLVD